MTESAHRFPDLHAALGIDLSKLGCIMATVEPIPVTALVDLAGAGTEADLVSTRGRRDDLWWIDGAVGEQKAHVTLLYGLLETGPVWRAHVDELLADVDLDAVTVDRVDVFDSPYPDEPYKCVVAKIALTPQLALAHARLSYLPHVNTFPDYTAHVTLAYVRDAPSDLPWAATVAEAWVRSLNDALRGAKLRVTGLDYGGNR